MQAFGAGKVDLDKAKKLKKAEGDKSSQTAVVAAKAALDRAQKARNKVQNEWTCLAHKFSSSIEISSLMRFNSPGENCEDTDRHYSLVRPLW